MRKLILILLACAGCTKVVIKDSVWYGSLGPLGASGFHTLTTGQESLSLSQWAQKWDDLNHPLVCTSVDTLADWKADLEKLCSSGKRCTYEEQQALTNFYQKVDSLKKLPEKVSEKKH